MTDPIKIAEAVPLPDPAFMCSTSVPEDTPAYTVDQVRACIAEGVRQALAAGEDAARLDWLQRATDGILTKDNRWLGVDCDLRDSIDAARTASTGEDARDAEITRLAEALARIGDFAHHRSTGPAVPDALWTVRAMAYDAVSPVISAAMTASTKEMPNAG